MQNKARLEHILHFRVQLAASGANCGTHSFAVSLTLSLHGEYSLAVQSNRYPQFMTVKFAVCHNGACCSRSCSQVVLSVHSVCHRNGSLVAPIANWRRLPVGLCNCHLALVHYPSNPSKGVLSDWSSIGKAVSLSRLRYRRSRLARWSPPRRACERG